MDEKNLAPDAATETAGSEPVTWNELFRECRAAAGLSQADVSTAAGITQARYSRFETGGSADLELSEIQSIKNFLDRFPVKNVTLVGSLLTLQQLLAGPTFPPVPEGGKLTEHIAKELEARHAREAAERADQELLRDVAELQAKADKYDALMEGSEITPRTKTLLVEHVELKKKYQALQKENAALSTQLAKLKGHKRRKVKSNG